MSFCHVLFIPLLAFCMAGCSANTDSVSTTTENTRGTAVLVETNTGSASNPQIVIDSSGNAIAIWSQYDGAYFSIYSNRYTASTGTWGSATLVEMNSGDANIPQITLDSSGNAVAIWTQFDVHHNGIYANHYSVSTGTWGSVVSLDTNITWGAEHPKIVMNSSGNAIAIWSQYDGTFRSIYASHYTAATGLWGTAALIETNIGEARIPKVAIDPSGNAVAVWHQNDVADFWSNSYSVWSNHYTASTGTWGTATLIETNMGSASSPQVVSDSSGNTIAVWQQYDGTRNNIWSNRYTASTGMWSTAALIETGNGDAYSPVLAIDSIGNSVAVWLQSDGGRFNTWANRYSVLTGTWGTAVQIESGAWDAKAPQVAIDSSGNAVVVWQQLDGSFYSIYSNRYTASSGTWSDAVLIESNTMDAENPQVAINASGSAVAIWYQYDGIPLDPRTCSNIWSKVGL
jgi:predicted enzyme related to lactoylglutathione lyase